MNVLRVWTGRLGTYRGDDGLDVTRSGAEKRPGPGAIFAPSIELLGPVLAARRAGQLTDATWERYVVGYTREMRISYGRHAEAWKKVLAGNSVVLLCFCVDRARCHRTALAEILVKLGAISMGERGPAPLSAPLFPELEAR